MDRQELTSQFTKLLTLAADWAAEQEERILREGMPLSEQEIADAKAAGVREPERVRLLPIESIPSPEHPVLKAVCAATNLVPKAPRGLTVRYGIFVRADCRQDRHVIAHELAHTAQYERLGGILPFLSKYLWECATTGYAAAPLEREALDFGHRVCPN